MQLPITKTELKAPGQKKKTKKNTKCISGSRNGLWTTQVQRWLVKGRTDNTESRKGLALLEKIRAKKRQNAKVQT